MPVPFAADVVAARKEPNPPCRQEMFLHHVGKVGTQLIGAGEFIEAGIQAPTVDGVLAQGYRIDAVEGGRLMQAYERIGIEPVPTGRVAAIDQSDACVAMRQKRIRHCHACGTSANKLSTREELLHDNRRHC